MKKTRALLNSINSCHLPGVLSESWQISLVVWSLSDQNDPFHVVKCISLASVDNLQIDGKKWEAWALQIHSNMETLSCPEFWCSAEGRGEGGWRGEQGGGRQGAWVGRERLSSYSGCLLPHGGDPKSTIPPAPTCMLHSPPEPTEVS